MTGVSLSSLCTPREFRRLFPSLERAVHLASCSLGARSTALEESLLRMLSVMSKYPGSAAWQDFEREVDRARNGFADLIGARPDQIAVLPNASISAYQVISTIPFGARSKIVTSVAEFPSIAHVWLGQCGRGADVRRTAADAYEREVDGGTALVSVPLVAYGSGAVLPVAEIAEIAHARGAPVFVDAYQAVGVLPVKVDDLHCDYLVAGTHKYLLGLPGVAFLYARDAGGGGLDPTLTGWFGRVDPFAFDAERLDFSDSARRLQTGTVAVPSLFAANAGLGLIGGLDLEVVRAHVRDLVDRAGRLLVDQGEEVRMPAGAAAQGAHVALVDSEPERLAAWLADRDIAVSPRGSLVRLSFHYYNNADDVNAVCSALRAFRRVNGQRV